LRGFFAHEVLALKNVRSDLCARSLPFLELYGLSLTFAVLRIVIDLHLVKRLYIATLGDLCGKKRSAGHWEIAEWQAYLLSTVPHPNLPPLGV
jgi:hypothetical protein